MEKYLKNVKNILELKDWLNDTSYNPLTKQNDVKMSLKEDSDYVMLYNKCFELFRQNGMKTSNILKKMPKNHLLFNNKIDYLYVYYNLDNEKYPYDGKDKKYLLYENYIKTNNDINGNIIFDKISYIIDYKNIEPNKYEKNIINDCYEFMIYCIDFFIILIRHKIFTNFPIEKLERNYKIEAIKKMNDINNIINFFNLIKYNFGEIYYEIKDDLYDNDFDKINIEEAVLIAIDVFKMIDYTVNGTDVIEIITESKLKIIEDPLINLLSNKEFENIDISNLELPEQNMTNKQFKNLTEEYSQLLEKFIKDNNNALSESKSPPKRPKIKMPNNKELTVGIHKIPKQNYTDDEYKKIKSVYKKNKPTIELYKQLINTGVLDLISSNSISSHRKSSKSISSHGSSSKSMLNKSRENIIKDDLYDDTITDNSRFTRCFNNTEIISQDEFDNPNYPLAKLQLMTKLHIKDVSGNLLRIDCYYTPNLYNHLITQANDKKPFTDPYNGKYFLTDNDINNIMKTMHVIDKNLEKPRYIKNSNDKKFEIGYEIENFILDNDIETFNMTKIYVYRLFGNIKFKILTIFSFPADIEVEDTGSSDMTSATLTVKIEQLFNNGKLMETYLPPYNVDGFYLLPDIDYNAYNDINKWIYMDKIERIELFKRMATEINAL
jgi:hypothetical protein